MVTHEQELVEYFGGRTIAMKNGEVVFDQILPGENAEEEYYAN